MKNNFESISIIGFGNVGEHLYKAFKSVGIEICQIYNRTFVSEEGITSFITDDITKIDSDLCLVCVSDDVVNEVINLLPKSSKIAYSAGSIDLESLDRIENIGVFYPLQTFSKDAALNYSEIPFFIESKNEKLALDLFSLASIISQTVNFADSDLRKKIHLSAVFVNNFVNHQLYIAEQLSQKYSFDFEFLIPLLKETINKAMINGAYLSQTGPAKRNDLNVISSQEKLLDGLQKEIYRVMTKSIIETYRDK